MSADQPYVCRNTLGCYIQVDRLNQSGTLEFEMLAEYGDDGVWPCLDPDAHNIFGVDYSFSFVFWEVKKPVPEKPISPFCYFFKLLLRSSDRMEGGTAADCHIPLTFSTSRSMGVGTWQLAMNACSVIKHAVLINAQPRGMSIISDSFRDAYGHQRICHMSKSDDK